MNMPPIPPMPNLDDPIWSAIRGEYETDDRMSAKALAKKYGVAERDVVARIEVEGWRRDGVEDADDDLPEDAVNLRNRLISQIATKGQVTIGEIPGILAFANIQALRGGKVKEIVEAATLAGKYKDLQAWTDSVDPNAKPDASKATMDELKKIESRIAEMLNGATPGAKQAFDKFRQALADRDRGSAQEPKLN